MKYDPKFNLDNISENNEQRLIIDRYTKRFYLLIRYMYMYELYDDSMNKLSTYVSDENIDVGVWNNCIFVATKINMYDSSFDYSIYYMERTIRELEVGYNFCVLSYIKENKERCDIFDRCSLLCSFSGKIPRIYGNKLCFQTENYIKCMNLDTFSVINKVRCKNNLIMGVWLNNNILMCERESEKEDLYSVNRDECLMVRFENGKIIRSKKTNKSRVGFICCLV